MWHKNYIKINKNFTVTVFSADCYCLDMDVYIYVFMYVCTCVYRNVFLLRVAFVCFDLFQKWLCHTLYALYSPCVKCAMISNHPTTFKYIVMIHINKARKEQRKQSVGEIQSLRTYSVSPSGASVFLEIQQDSHRDSCYGTYLPLFCWQLALFLSLH